ncbi:hypothetical protein LTR17_013251 [Elasticomyces elasticus]|nr:hypothetical protein LTR17_013251 [Elasticomyces elasticus]
MDKIINYMKHFARNLELVERCELVPFEGGSESMTSHRTSNAATANESKSALLPPPAVMDGSDHRGAYRFSQVGLRVSTVCTIWRMMRRLDAQLSLQNTTFWHCIRLKLRARVIALSSGPGGSMIDDAEALDMVVEVTNISRAECIVELGIMEGNELARSNHAGYFGPEEVEVVQRVSFVLPGLWKNDSNTYLTYLHLLRIVGNAWEFELRGR